MFVADPLADMALRGLLLSLLAMLWIILLVRIVGLRSFSKMTNFDFVMTIACGSLLAGAGQATEWTGFGQAMTALLALFVIQYIAARLRTASETAEDVMQNRPTLLMRDGAFLRGAMAQQRVTESDILAKLREANALDLSKVQAVVLETTGDVSVLHGDAPLSGRLLSEVRGFQDTPASS